MLGLAYGAACNQLVVGVLPDQEAAGALGFGLRPPPRHRVNQQAVTLNLAKLFQALIAGNTAGRRLRALQGLDQD